MKRLILSLILTIPAIAAAASFQGLGAGSVANDISADGTVVVGSGRWTQQTSWQDIGATATACSRRRLGRRGVSSICRLYEPICKKTNLLDCLRGNC